MTLIYPQIIFGKYIKHANLEKKEIWQMTRFDYFDNKRMEEFEKIEELKNEMNNLVESISDVQYQGKSPMGRYIRTQNKIVKLDEQIKNLEKKLEPDNVYSMNFMNKIHKEHKNLVQQALSEGKLVPEEVLANYPDLIEKYK